GSGFTRNLRKLKQNKYCYVPLEKKVIFIAKLVKAKIFIHDIKIKLEEINSQFRNKKNYQPATHTK
ncbi:hypothetical protein C0M34_13190, partial [Listeria monocytogenes]|nr:hypothetical protein [Listeria monocytogenes]